jgi:CRP-like cAMP-binding protein
VAVTVERLQAVPLFSELDRKALKQLASAMKERTFPPDAVVTEEGTGGVGFFVIDDGEAEVSVDGQVKRTLVPGDHFGEIALLTKTPRSATIRAKTDLRCFVLTAWQFKPLVQKDGTLAWKLLLGLAKMLA